MLEIDNLASFFVISLLLGLSPGPDILYVLNQSMAHGSRSGVQITLGLCTGLVLHTLVVAFGVAIIIRQSPYALSLIQYTGVGYLLYLAWQMWRDAVDPSKQNATNQLDAWVYYRRGVLMNITNPKVLLFFLAFLPQFVQQGPISVSLQIMLLGLIFILAAILVFMGAALSAHMVFKKWMASKQHFRVMNKLSALIFIALAINLLFAELT